MLEQWLDKELIENAEQQPLGTRQGLQAEVEGSQLDSSRAGDEIKAAISGFLNVLTKLFSLSVDA
jgi:hypothetical protein